MDFDFIPGKQGKSLRVGIVHADAHYREDIIRYYENSDDIIRIVHQTQSFEDLLLYLNMEDLDVMLIDQHITEQELNWFGRLQDAGVMKVIVITDDLAILNELDISDPNMDLIYKYTPMGSYTHKILSFTPKGKQKDVFTQVNQVVKEQNHKKQVLFYSPKGGVGTTTIAVNTACQLALKDKKVLLVDFAIFGHVAIHFSLPQRKQGLSDVISIIEQGVKGENELAEAVRDAIQSVSIQGKKLHLLSASSPIKMTGLTLEQTDQILQVLSQLDYDVIIFDTSTELSEKNIALLSAVTDLFFIMTTDVATNWSLLSAVEIIRKLNRPLQSRYLIINAYHDSIGFPLSELESLLSMEVSALIPYKYQQVQGYTNRGIVMAEKPFLKLNKNYRSIANMIEPVFSKSELAKRNGLSKGVFA